MGFWASIGNDEEQFNKTENIMGNLIKYGFSIEAIYDDIYSFFDGASSKHIEELAIRLSDEFLFNKYLNAISEEFDISKQQGLELGLYRIMLSVNKDEKERLNNAKWKEDIEEFQLVEPEWLENCPTKINKRVQSKNNPEISALELQIKANIWL